MRNLLLILLSNVLTFSVFGQLIISNPPIKLRSDENLSIISIELSKEKTLVTCRFRNGDYFGQIRTAKPGNKKAFYIADENGNRIAELVSVKNLSSEKRTLAPNETVSFELAFSPIDSTKKIIDIIEGNASQENWCFYGIRLESTNLSYDPLPSLRNEENLPIKSSGTGFIISTDGYVVTNFHVIENAVKINLVFEDGVDKKIVKARPLLLDKTNDIAILKIDDSSYTNYQTIPYKLSEEYDVGEDVFTLGYPHPDIMGLEVKLTTGIINSLSGIDNDNTCLQTSVQIQPGNSGGPLFNHNGDVIGITTSSLNSIFMVKYKGNIPQNVNYAVKTEYIKALSKNLNLNSVNSLSKLDLKEKVKILRSYICLIIVY